MASRYPRLGVVRDPVLEHALSRTKALLPPEEARSSAAQIRALALRGADSVLDQVGPAEDLRKRLGERSEIRPACRDPRSIELPVGGEVGERKASEALQWVRGQ